MFSLTRTTARQASRPLRLLSNATSPESRELVVTSLNAGPSKPRRTRKKLVRPTSSLTEPVLVNTKVPVREDHGLYAFFRKRRNNNLPGEAGYEVVETPEDGQLITGRAWEASELRNKCFKDLHTLWYVALRERNLLATQKEEARRMGVANVDLQVPAEKVRACRKTMARIKAVLNERRLAYEGAAKIAETQLLAAIHAQAKPRAYNADDQTVLEYLHSSPTANTEVKEPTTGRRRGKPKPRKGHRGTIIAAH